MDSNLMLPSSVMNVSPCSSVSVHPPSPGRQHTSFTIGDIMKSAGIPTGEDTGVPAMSSTPISFSTTASPTDANAVARPPNFYKPDATTHMASLPDKAAALDSTPVSQSHPSGLYTSPAALYNEALLRTTATQDYLRGRLNAPVETSSDTRVGIGPSTPLPTYNSYSKLNQSAPSAQNSDDISFPRVSHPVTENDDFFFPSGSGTTPEVSPYSLGASPSIDTQGSFLAVEGTSPTGSNASSGFYSNPSPTQTHVFESTSAPVNSPGSPNSPPSGRTTAKDAYPPMNQRTCYSDEQTERLKDVFEESKYPEVETYEQLSRDMDISIQKLRIWFQNRRARRKRRGSRMTSLPPMLPPSAYSYLMSNPMMHQSSTIPNTMMHQSAMMPNPMMHQFPTMPNPMMYQSPTIPNPMMHQFPTMPNPMMHQFKYPTSPASPIAFAPSMYAGYRYPFQY